jgi:A/G-specific adenine glycosylase
LLQRFRADLLDWYFRVRRDLPWRRTTDPYSIWVSEIMLQQTRVATVVPYYERFLVRFPDIRSLAEAPEDELLAVWAGLGYYSRVRNMQRAARRMSGAFPHDYESIRALPGIGDYTAAAVASIAFGLPHAAVDGNVLRVASRVLNDAGDIKSPVTRKRLTAFAQTLLDRDAPGAFNQALMELGATICTPKQPRCLYCPLADLCEARAAGTQSLIPVSAAQAEPIRFNRTLYVVLRKRLILLWQRPAASSRLAGFWELPGPEHFAVTPESRVLGSFRHSITNGRYAFEVRLIPPEVSTTCKKVANCRFVPLKTIENMALSTTARKALRIFFATLA